MKIVSAKLKRYSIPLASPLTIKTGKLKTRSGALLFLTGETGITACGELAPLETLHTESLNQAADQLQKLKDHLTGKTIPETFTEFSESIETFLPFAPFPSVTTAMETAILNLFNQQGAFNDLKNIQMPVNALLSADPDDFCDSATELINQGFKSIKVKVGRSDIEKEIAAINKLSETVKHKAKIRLDANRQWPLDKALRFCNETASPVIEYIEEPLADISEIPEFTKQSKIPLALDETLSEKKLQQLKQFKNIAAFILKPAVIGGLKKTADLVKFAKQNNITPVISSAFETSVSQKAYSIFAAKMGLQNTAHGLDTLKYLASDTTENPLKITNGKIHLNKIITETQSASAGIKTISGKLINSGIKPNDRIAIISENSPEYMLLVLALWNIGAVPVPLSTRYTPDQINHAIESTSSKSLFVSKPYRKVGRAHAENFHIEDFINLNTNRIAGLTFQDFNFNLNADAAIIFTSSSTGSPKAVLHTIANHYCSALGSDKNIPFEKNDAWLMSLPMYHISGFSLIMRALINGGAIIFPQPETSLQDAIENPDLTHISLVPAQLSVLLESEQSIKHLQKFKAILLGGSAIPAKLLQRSIDCNLPVCTTYGSTEMASQITTTSPGQAPAGIGSSGKLLLYREMKLTDDSEIIVKGKTLFKGYVKKDTLELPLDPEGFFHTNDIGKIDTEGNLFVTSRKDLMFISGGENIHPQQIEREIEKIENVDRAIVVLVNDARFGKKGIAFIKTTRDIEPDFKYIEVKLRNKIEAFKIPKAFYPWPKQMETSLKPDRKALQALAETQSPP